MYYRLREGLHHCLAGRRVIFLDLAQDRYLALPPASAIAFQRLVSRGGEAFDGARDALSPLVERGDLIETESSDPSIFPASIAIPKTDDRRDGLSLLSFPTFVAALYWELRASLALRNQALSAVIRHTESIRSRKPPNAATAKRQLSEIAAAFDYTAYLLGRANRCLPRSLAMYSLCRKRGVAAELVIGVRSDPFAAHAWIQNDAMVLTDTAEQVGLYTPILVLR
ncbi:lasso peptide biosynthesis B2 protein [Sphingomonas sp. AP4-R1]|uniref:lasso peptide biosynthesis B2 protein n=1 Tax=Sphingomonas sp. AP4-R1 TaxID=2735134 RepID=UPI001493C0BD|nr:lasso peptide biosynthesis B2 protein [Sphingomonas sp. AP4-R1]QJU58444.1 lasso peptide biosynthesis B2 protein [Sphingomonas sp. AP4-R1]